MTQTPFIREELDLMKKGTGTNAGMQQQIDSLSQELWDMGQSRNSDVENMTQTCDGINDRIDGVEDQLSGKQAAFEKTVTPAGTTEIQTINKSSGSVNMAADTISLRVNNSLVTESSIVLATVATNDPNTGSIKAVAGDGFFTLYPDVTPAAETRVNFTVVC